MRLGGKLQLFLINEPEYDSIDLPHYSTLGRQNHARALTIRLQITPEQNPYDGKHLGKYPDLECHAQRQV